ncbi:hypothetical protein AAFO92_16150 [Roseovarius sp. CAU 1744]|uniref:hypothetical protein n=1 Tax=Roseovarius sp. CAU 1744 TaxID=3140368 RepID=UPI00325B3AF1
MKELTPPKEIATYKTSGGLEFWLDYTRSKEPFIAPTIRTRDPEICIIFVPNSPHADEAYLMRYHGKLIIFSRPDNSSRLHNSRFDDLAERNPGVDFVINSIGNQTVWSERPIGSSDVKLHEISSAEKFDNEQQQNQMLRLFKELMSYKTYGVSAMLTGTHGKSKAPLTKKVVDFDLELKSRLKSGVFLK